MKFAKLVLFFWALMAAMVLAGPHAARAAGDGSGLEPGIYQYESLATCELKPLSDGAWQMLLWQGGTTNGPGQGYVMLGRLVPDAAMRRFSGTWQALPGSCCPGRGRLAIEVLDATSFRFTVFATSLERHAWSLRPDVEYKKVADLIGGAGASSLAGDWRLAMYYSDLLPAEAPADQVQGALQLQVQGDGAQGVWLGRPGQVSLVPTGAGLDLSYVDQKAGFELHASLAPEAGGLAYAGGFSSTLGQGRLRLVRSGLPADPPGMEISAGQGLSGVWVDPRTGSDYFEINGSPLGFEFSAYGGLATQPRYLSKGRARPVGQGVFKGEAQDVSGYCCGNQGRLTFRRLGEDRLEVTALWWPQGRPQPKTPPAEPYVIQRVQKSGPEIAAVSTPGARWPLVFPAKPGLMSPNGGSIKVRFVWRPAESRQEAALFSQGGYLRDLDLYLDPRGRLGLRMAMGQGELNLLSEKELTAGEPHEAFLSYQAGEQASLYLDGELAARAEMFAPWNGSRSPYLVGASRWPGRGFQGDIELVELWKTPQPMDAPAPPDLAVKPPPETDETGPAVVQQGETPSRRLLRLWHPGRLVHAYAAGAEQAAQLKANGFEMQGPLGRLAARQEQGGQPLYAFRNRAEGYTILQTKPEPPKGADSLGLMGYIWPRAGEGTTPLHQLSAVMNEPLRGGQRYDLLYTTLPETVEAAKAAGYGQSKLIGYLRPAQEPDYQPPLRYDWSGSWQGEGWGRFFISRKGDELFMFWYYGRMDGPHYFGRYRLSPDGRKAEGIAVGRPGEKAIYFRHRLVFDTASTRGPRIKLTSWRLAAPLDDGRLVRYLKPRFKDIVLQKNSQSVPAEEQRVLSREQADATMNPARMFEQALAKAKSRGALLERE